jgi:hypothetical protein
VVAAVLFHRRGQRGMTAGVFGVAETRIFLLQDGLQAWFKVQRIHVSSVLNAKKTGGAEHTPPAMP